MINQWGEEFFPDPDEYIADRWLVDGQSNHRLQRFLSAFGKANRTCVGEQQVVRECSQMSHLVLIKMRSRLAYDKLYHMAAFMALRIILRAHLYKNTVDAISCDHELIVVHTR